MSKFKMQLGLNECSNEEYHSDSTYLSSSDLKLLLKDPAEFKRTKIDGGKKEEQKAGFFDEGSLAHSYILEPHLVEKEYAFFKGMRRAGADYEAFKAANPGKKIITTAKREEVKAWIRQYQANKVAVELHTGGYPEYTLAQIFHGVPLKCRADYINIDLGYIIDEKTSRMLVDTKESVEIILEQYDYPLSAALYSALFAQYYGKQFDFYWNFIGKSPPDCKVYRMAATTRMKGLQRVHKAIDIYKRCMQTGLWVAEESTVKVQETIEEV